MPKDMKGGPGLAILIGEKPEGEGAEKPKGDKREPSKMATAAAKDLISALDGKDEVKLARVLDVLMGSGEE